MNSKINFEIGKTYYFNNRKVKLLAKTTETMFLVSGNTSGINIEIEGAHFCEACMVGSDTYASHRCEEAEHIIDEIVDFSSQEADIFWVDSKFLTLHCFEYRQNEELQKEVDDKIKSLLSIAEIKSSLKKEILELESQKKSLNEDIATIKESLHSEAEEASQYKEELNSEIEDLEEILNSMKEIQSSSGVQLEFSEYLDLICKEIKLNALENGGVDNWEWYDESLKELGDENALRRKALEEVKNKLIGE